MDEILAQYSLGFSLGSTSSLGSIPDISLLLQDIEMDPSPESDGKIGEGSFGTIYLIDGKVHKKMKYQSVDDFGEETFGVDNISEITFLSSHKAPFLPEVFDIKIDGPTISIVEEYCGRDLFDLGDILDEETKYKITPNILLQMARILMWMKRRKVAHMDIKPENLCLTKEGRLVLIDWGFVSPVYKNSAKYFGTEKYGDPNYLNSSRSVTCEYDMIGMGLSLYDFLSQSIPTKSQWKHVASFPPEKQQDYAWGLLKQIKTIEKNFNKYLGNQLGGKVFKMFQSMLLIDEKKRIKCHTIYTNPIFRDLWSTYPIISCDPIQSEITPVKKYSSPFFKDYPEIQKLGEKIFGAFIQRAPLFREAEYFSMHVFI